MSTKDDGGAAFPVANSMGDICLGMSLRAYAAIKLRVPDSGIDWLDEMILKAKRDELAAAALQGLLSTGVHPGGYGCEMYSEYAHKYADAMIAERNK